MSLKCQSGLFPFSVLHSPLSGGAATWYGKWKLGNRGSRRREPASLPAAPKVSSPSTLDVGDKSRTHAPAPCHNASKIPEIFRAALPKATSIRWTLKGSRAQWNNIQFVSKPFLNLSPRKSSCERVAPSSHLAKITEGQRPLFLHPSLPRLGIRISPDPTQEGRTEDALM